MPEPVTYPFTQQRIDERAQGNVTALILGSLAYAKAQGRDGRHWATFMGQAFAPTWNSVATPQQAATSLALNCASAGMRIVSVNGDESRGEAVTGDWPEAEALSLFGLSQAEADEFWDIFAPIAQSLGMRFAWRREGDQLHFSFTK